MVKHLGDQSAILDRLTTAERYKHFKWLQGGVVDMHAARRGAGGEPGRDPALQGDLARMATARGAFRAAASIDVLLDAAAPTGKIWASKPDRYGRAERLAVRQIVV